ncbi:gamma-soluble NSF attachment protein [Iris pallida]|uniref:Gamma-soluble NSF attachment protein n=1 Tax=Iris pallida TaxID=29817 RepID=A0AAX6I8V1_IRIPA|nr:gamma-soluble NSF attachment protein [Iris pallida]
MSTLRTKLSFTRWTADWKAATVLYEQAAINYRIIRDDEKAKLAFEKASKGHEMISSPWDAAKHMESAGALAKELGRWGEVSDHFRKACKLYNECGRSQSASDALAKGARALEDADPEEAIRLYADACEILEDDGKDQMAFDLFRAGARIYIKLEKYVDAVTFMLRLGVASDKCHAVNSQCKAYLSAIIIYLYAHDFKQAQKCYNDCYQIAGFLNSDHSICASKLLCAYKKGDAEEIKRIAQYSTISNLDHVIIRLARKLPMGDLKEIYIEATNNEVGLDENDLT